MAANVLPVRLRIDPGESRGDFVSRTSRTVRAAMRHQRYRYEDMLRDLNAVDGAPLFQLSVNVMSFDYPVRFGDCTAVTRTSCSGPTHDLRVNVYDRPGAAELIVEAEVNCDLYADTDAEVLSRRFVRALRSLTDAAPGEPISRTSLLEDDERRQVLVEWNDTAASNLGTSAHVLFEAQVARAPDAVAVVLGEWVSYAELDARANGWRGCWRAGCGCGVGGGVVSAAVGGDGGGDAGGVEGGGGVFAGGSGVSGGADRVHAGGCGRGVVLVARVAATSDGAGGVGGGRLRL